jgi:hypothetical protein
MRVSERVSVANLKMLFLYTFRRRGAGADALELWPLPKYVSLLRHGRRGLSS